MWQYNHERNPKMLLRNANDLYVPMARTEQTKRLPYFELARLWNELPDIKITPEPSFFRYLIKQHLLLPHQTP
jgi:hypothetical protein